MTHITRHSKQRIVERNNEVNTFYEAKRYAKTAYNSGKTLNCYQSYPEFFKYLQRKANQSNECIIRIYKGCIYIWRGKKKTLRTAMPIPDRFQEGVKALEQN